MGRFFQTLKHLFARERLIENLRPAFTFERVICRLIASWCCFVLTTLKEPGAFVEPKWLQDTTLSTVALISLLFFLLLSLFAILIGKINTDALFLLISSTVCISLWCGNAPTVNREWFLISAIAVYSLFVIRFHLFH